MTPSTAHASVSASAIWWLAIMTIVGISGSTGSVWASRRSRWEIGFVQSAGTKRHRRSREHVRNGLEGHAEGGFTVWHVIGETRAVAW
jgi:hypothetical protein